MSEMDMKRMLEELEEFFLQSGVLGEMHQKEQAVVVTMENFRDTVDTYLLRLRVVDRDSGKPALSLEKALHRDLKFLRIRTA